MISELTRGTSFHGNRQPCLQQMVSNDIIQSKRIAVQVITVLGIEGRIRFINMDMNGQKMNKIMYSNFKHKIKITIF